jgi:hypothetical protein
VASGSFSSSLSRLMSGCSDKRRVPALTFRVVNSAWPRSGVETSSSRRSYGLVSDASVSGSLPTGVALTVFTPELKSGSSAEGGKGRAELSNERASISWAAIVACCHVYPCCHGEARGRGQHEPGQVCAFAFVAASGQTSLRRLWSSPYSVPS